jgi:hypothetical protein
VVVNHAHILSSERAEHHVSWGGAFGDGLKRHGWRVTVSASPRPCDLLVLWGARRVETMAAQRAAGGEVAVLERGYVGERFEWASVSFGGGLNGRGEFRGPFTDGSRWVQHFGHLMQPWRDRNDGDILIMGQVDGDMAVANVDIHEFYRRAEHRYLIAGFLTRFRPHPGMARRERVTLPHRALASDLAEARAVVTWNSNSGVDAVLAGIPTVAIDEGSMAWSVAGHTLGELPPAPDRTAWAHRLAWCQWRRDEIVRGDCWDAVAHARCAA